MVRILLADDHDVLRLGLRELLSQQTGWDVCGEATTGRQAVEMALRLRPDVVILDITMPQLNGIDATRQIRKAGPDTEVLVYTMHESEQLITDLLTAGARGYLLKSDPPCYIISAVEALARHKPFFTAKASEALVESVLANKGAGESGRRGDLLTQRERQIIQLLAESNSSKKIAALLSISVKTVETHRSAIMRKLDMHSVVDIVHFAIRNNLVKP